VLHKEIPFLRIGLPLCAGIVTGLYYKPDIIILAAIAIIVITGFIISLFFNNYQANRVFGISLTIALFTIGLILYTNEKNVITSLKPESAIYSCTLTDFPAEKENSFLLTVKLNKIFTRDGTEQVKGSMILYNKKDSIVSSLLPGDLLIIKCTPALISNKGNPYEFDYRFFMENQDIRYYAYASNIKIIRHQVPHNRKLAYRALIIREKIIGIYKEMGVTGERLGLVAAIILGQKNMLEPGQKQIFIKAGIMHIMAVSGLHAVILSLFVFNLLFFLKRRFNILRVLLTIIILWSFAFVTGLTPSVLRATLMFTFLQAGTLMKRRVNGINSVLASAFVLIIIRPSVIFDAGFLLSYSAVIYIISFYSDFYTKLHFKNRVSDNIWQSAVVTIIAQAGTLPLTIMLFNRFPTYFILTNIIIVPISSLLIVVGCIVPMVYPIHFLSHWFAVLLSYLTGLTELLTAKASSLPYASIENIGMTSIECILLTLTIFLFTHFLLKKYSFSFIYPISALILFVLAGTVREISNRTTNEIIVYNTPGSTNIGIKTGKILNLYSDTSKAAPEVLKHCVTLGLKLKVNNNKSDIYCIDAGKKRILISNLLNNKILQYYTPDIVILSGLQSQIEKTLPVNKEDRTLIISPEVSSGFRMSQQAMLSSFDSIHLVKMSGAFVRKL
jgi:competence protein ComEC